MTAGQIDAGLSRSPLYEQLAERVREMIEAQELWGQRLAPERELAGAFGVSQDTVRRGLQALAAEGLLVRRSGRGTMVLAKPPSSGGKSRTRVLLVSAWERQAPDYVGHMISGLGAGISSEANWNADFTDVSSPPGRAALLENLRTSPPDGMIMISVTDRTLIERCLQVWNGPIVVLDHQHPDLPVTSVCDDGRGGAQMAVKHLISLGHRRIGFVDVARQELNPWRRDGYIAALRAADMEVDPELIVNASGSVLAGMVAGEQLLDLANPPTAVFAFDGQRAWGVWQAAERRGLEVGRDFAIIGVGGAQQSAPDFPGLSIVMIDAWELGRVAVRELRELVAGRSQRRGEVQVAPELVLSKSSEPGAPRTPEQKEEEA